MKASHHHHGPFCSCLIFTRIMSMALVCIYLSVLSFLSLFTPSLISLSSRSSLSGCWKPQGYWPFLLLSLSLSLSQWENLNCILLASSPLASFSKPIGEAGQREGPRAFSSNGFWEVVCNWDSLYLPLFPCVFFPLYRSCTDLFCCVIFVIVSLGYIALGTVGEWTLTTILPGQCKDVYRWKLTTLHDV